MAIVGAVRTNTLLMLVPSRMREVRIAQAARSELITAMPLGDPGRLISEVLGENDKVNHLRRVGAT